MDIESLVSLFESTYDTHPLASPNRSDKKKLLRYLSTVRHFPENTGCRVAGPVLSCVPFLVALKSRRILMQSVYPI